MKKTLSIIFFVVTFNSINAHAQNAEDSLKAIIKQQRGDTIQVRALIALAGLQTRFDSALMYAEEGLQKAKELNYKEGEADCYFALAKINNDESNVSIAIQYSLNALTLYEELRDHPGIVSAHLSLQGGYREAADFKNALVHAMAGAQIAEANNVVDKKGTFPDHRLAPLLLAEIGQTYLLLQQLDSALIYTEKSIAQNELFNGAVWNFPVYLLATIQNLKGQYQPALKNYRRSLSLSIQNKLPWDTLQIQSGMSTLFLRLGQPDSAIYYANGVAHNWRAGLEIKTLLEAVGNLAQAYKIKDNKDSTLKYLELRETLKDSIFSKEKVREIQNIAFNERLKRQEIAVAEDKYKSKIQLYALVAGLFVMVLIAVILWRTNLQKQLAKTNIEKAYTELKATQAQLIQSEKMASLGELTAGIAHEIQNPLNFVNNFSEVNEELLSELKGELGKGKVDDAIALANNAIENQQKINHHGKRADAIVKSMLQHSRTSSGTKEPTNINALCDEYLRLSYHGLRAKDKTFKAKFETNFDSTLAKINVAPQEIGRVILNLINNAFYAATEKRKTSQGEHAPTILVTTKKLNVRPEDPFGVGTVEITISDNGSGIPQDVLDKIFQPFFTTKPAGQGTGLGLSLSYDIIKAHGGELKVETKEREGSKFIIQLPG
jgi:two-component system, NtrC family, sensor kinase